MPYLNKISGIYTITNLVNNKVYVGYASNVPERMSRHRSDLKFGIHGNEHLQNSWNKYGEENFKFELLEESPIEYLPCLENYWCNLLNSHDKNLGYNKRKTGLENVPKSMNPETKAKLSNYWKLKYEEGYKQAPISEETRKKLSENSRKYNTAAYMHTPQAKEKMEKSRYKRSVLKFSLDGEFIEEFSSVNAAKNSIGNKWNTGIIACCAGRVDSYSGFIWKYKNNK